VLSHLTPGLDNIKDEEWRDGAAKYFKGEIIVANDLTVV
jgi:ribonuclease BN (tRNA processing enzyme)